MAVLAKTDALPVTADDFLASTARMGAGKHVLIDGVVYAMAPASPTHGLIQANLAGLIHAHFQASKLPCRVMAEAGVKPRVRAKTNVRVPDLTVTSGPPPGPADKLVDQPLITIEVLSPSNDDLTDASIMACATIPSVMEMLVVDSQRVFVEVWRRGSDGAWPSEPDVTTTGNVTLAAIHLGLSISDIYADTHLSAH